MAHMEDLRLEDFLDPIPGSENPAGPPDQEYELPFTEMEAAYARGMDDVPPREEPGFPGPDAKREFQKVVKGSISFLQKTAKDLRAAQFLTNALLRTGLGPEKDHPTVRGLAGVAFGLSLCRSLMEEYGGLLYPDPASQSAVLSQLLRNDLPAALNLLPLTVQGHHFHHYDQWKTQERLDVTEDEEHEEYRDLGPWNFGSGLRRTSSAFYAQVLQELGRVSSALEELSTQMDQLFEQPKLRPSTETLRDTLGKLSLAAELLEKRKKIEAPEEVPT